MTAKIITGKILPEAGGRLFPDHERIQQAAKVLSPPIISKVYSSQTKGLEASMAWFDNHADQYRGQWVAVREGQLLGVASSLAELTPVIGEGEDTVSTIVTKVRFAVDPAENNFYFGTVD